MRAQPSPSYEYLLLDGARTRGFLQVDAPRHGILGTLEAVSGLEFVKSARAGNRTLNLGIKRRLTSVARKRQEKSGRASGIRRSHTFVPQSVLACHRASCVSCQTSC